MDLQKERQAFEKLPDINAILHNSEFGFNECINQYYHPNHTEHRLNYAFLMGAWSAWQEAKAQAVLEVKPSRCVTLTCAQLREAFMFGAPDKDDQEQLETEMTISWSENGHSGKGYYCYYSDLPEEGAIFLDDVIEAQEQAYESK